MLGEIAPDNKKEKAGSDGRYRGVHGKLYCFGETVIRLPREKRPIWASGEIVFVGDEELLGLRVADFTVNLRNAYVNETLNADRASGEYESPLISPKSAKMNFEGDILRCIYAIPTALRPALFKIGTDKTIDLVRNLTDAWREDVDEEKKTCIAILIAKCPASLLNFQRSRCVYSILVQRIKTRATAAKPISVRALYLLAQCTSFALLRRS